MLPQKPRAGAVPTCLRLVLLSAVTACAAGTAVVACVAGLAWVRGGRTAAAPESPAGQVAPVRPEARVGEPAPDFALRDLEGRPVRLSDWRGRMPVVIEFGSYSCPRTTGQAHALDELAREYEGRAQFLLVYDDEAHPGDGQHTSMSYGPMCLLPQVRDRADRLEHARLFRREVKITRRILVDEDGERSASKKYGTEPQVVVVDARGRLRLMSDAPSGGGLASFLREEVGEPSEGPPPAGAFLAP